MFYTLCSDHILHPSPSTDFMAFDVKELNREYRAEWAAQKERAREEQKERRELVLDDRRAQTAALVTALNAMTKVVGRLEAKSAGE